MKETLDFNFEAKALEDDSDVGTFEGYASVFGQPDYVSDIVAKGAFSRTLREHRKKGRMPALLWQHDVREPIGVWEEMKEDSHGLYARGKLFVDDISRARQAYALLKGNGLSGLSIGFITVKSQIDEKKKVRTLLDVDLFETSLVTFPALDSARVSDVKSEDIKTIRDFEAFLRDVGGFSHSAAKQIASCGFKEANSDHRDDAEVVGALGDLLNSYRQGISTLTHDGG